MSTGDPARSRVTITDLAAELGVTPATVSNAFNRPDQLSAGLRERVLATAARMGYLGPDAAARGLRRGRLRTIGVVYADRLSNAFVDAAFVLFLQGLAEALEEADLGMTLLPGTPVSGRGPGAVGAAVVDGFVVYSMADDDPLLAAAIVRRLPLVSVDSPQLPGVPYVGIDDERAARMAAKHLLDLGHRDFAAIAGELGLDRQPGPADEVRQEGASYGVNRARLRGYAAALTEAGIAWGPVPVEEAADDPDRESRAAMRRLMARTPRPTGILAMSDRIARGAIAAAQESGLSIPDELSIIGFDDDPEAARSEPSLTTLRQPHAEKGRVAGRFLIAQLEGRIPGEPVILPTEMVVRESTGPPP